MKVTILHKIVQKLRIYGVLPPALLDKSQRVALLNPWTNSQFIFMAWHSWWTLRLPHCWGFKMTLRHTILGRTHLDEWSARRRSLYLTTHNIYDTGVYYNGGIQNRNSNKRAAEDLRLRPRGNWDRRPYGFAFIKWRFLCMCLCVYVCVCSSTCCITGTTDYNLMFFWPCIMNWLYNNYQLDALTIIYS